MNMMPDITVGGELLGLELYSRSFDEFCETLDELKRLNDDELYIEAVDDPRVMLLVLTGISLMLMVTSLKQHGILS